MAFNAGAVTGSLGIDINPFAKGMLQAEGIMRLFPASIATFIGNPLLGIADIAKQATQALVSNLISVAQAADDAGEQAAKLGVSAQFLTAYGSAAGLAGASAESFGDALRFLSVAQADVIAGNKDTISTFNRLGISAGEVKDAKLETLFKRLADGIKDTASQAERIELSQALFGRGGSALLPLIQGGTKALNEQADVFVRLGATVDDELADAGGKFTDFRGLVGAAFTGIRNEIAKPLLKSFAEDYEASVDALVMASEAARDAIKFAWRGIADALGIKPDTTLLDSAKSFRKWVDDNGPWIQKTVREVTDGIEEGIKALLPILKLLITEGDKLIAALLAAWTASTVASIVKGVTSLAKAYEALAVGMTAANAAAGYGIVDKLIKTGAATAGAAGAAAAGVAGAAATAAAAAAPAALAVSLTTLNKAQPTFAQQALIASQLKGQGQFVAPGSFGGGIGATGELRPVLVDLNRTNRELDRSINGLLRTVGQASSTVSDAARDQESASKGDPAAAPQTTNNFNVDATISGIDTDRVTRGMTDALRPIVIRAAEDQRRAVDAEAARQRVRGGIGG